MPTIRMEKKIYFLASIIFIFLSLIPIVSAINATSGNYTIDMFGNFLHTSNNTTSSTYNATFLLTATGSTRGANTTTYTANIGFFDNVTFNRSVAINTYSISPTSAEIGSTITLGISATNAQAVWANVTSPNNQEQRITLINNDNVTFLPIPSVVGTYTVIFYANSSTGAIASVVSSFTLTAATTTTTTGGGGGTTTTITPCTYNWDCTPWSVCADGVQTRQCKNIGTCTGTESKPIEEIACTEALFDILLKLKSLNLNENRSLIFTYDLIEQIGVEKIDVHVKYSVIDDKNNEIFSQIETLAVEKNLSLEKEIDEIKFVDGKYTLRVDILYGNLQRAFAEEGFEVRDGKIKTEEEEKGGFITIISIILIVLIVIVTIIFILLYRRRKETSDGSKEGIYNYLAEGIKRGFSTALLKQKLLEARFNKKDIDENLSNLNKHIQPMMMKKYLAYGLVILVVIALLLVGRFLLTGNITENAIGNESVYSTLTIMIILIILIAGLLFFYWKEVLAIRHSNTIFGLVNKKVYTESGDYIGRVEEVILHKNEIDSLKIRLDSKKKYKTKGLILKYGHVKAIKRIVIIKNFEIDKLFPK